MEIVENKFLGQGWHREFVQRKSSKQIDVILLAPSGKKIRHSAELGKLSKKCMEVPILFLTLPPKKGIEN